jgi:hypothetical protein
MFNPIFFAGGENPNVQPASFLDAANPSSYPGSGATWTDLKGVQNCTLVNSPSFNSANGGSIQFDGIDDYGNMGSAYNFTTQNFSFSVWAYITSLTTTSGGQGPVLFSNGQYNSYGYYCQIGTDGSVSFNTNQPSPIGSYTGSSEVSVGSWCNITITKKSNAVKIYVNGVDKTTVNGVHGNIASASRNLHLGAYRAPDIPGVAIYSNIRIAKFQVYNKALSPAAVKFNFKTYKSIYGL